MHTWFTVITNKLHYLGEDTRPTKLVRKVLNILSKSWESKVNAINEDKDFNKMTMDELIGNIKTHELKKQQDKARGQQKKKINLVLKSTKQDSSTNDEETTYITKRFLKIMRRTCALLRREESSRQNGDGKANDICHKCEIGKLYQKLPSL